MPEKKVVKGAGAPKSQAVSDAAGRTGHGAMNRAAGRSESNAANGTAGMAESDDISMYKKQSQLVQAWGRLRKNRVAIAGMVILLVLMFCAVFAEQLAPYGYDDQDVMRRFTFPCREFPFGTDNLGRCIYSRILYGSRISLLIGFVATGMGAAAGTVLGAVAGYYGKGTDNMIMRFCDILQAIPSLLLAIAIAAALGSGLFNMMLAISIGAIPRYARTVRASILTVKEQEFIEAAHAIGAGDIRIIMKHIFPNCLAPIIVQVTLGVAGSIINAASLSFIGLGVQAPAAEWGSMLSAGRQYVRDYWFVVMFPGLAIMTTILSLNLFGDGLRDALDPKLK